jgi:hypothetical protein
VEFLEISKGAANATGPVTPTQEKPMQIGVDTERAVDDRRVFVVDDDEITSAALQFMLHDEIETHELSSLEAAYAKAVD